MEIHPFGGAPYHRNRNPRKGVSPMTWREQAACRNHNPEVFFPFPTSTPGNRRAKAVCWNQCPVREQCLTYALHHGETHGVWGGASEHDRDDMLRRPHRHATRSEQEVAS